MSKSLAVDKSISYIMLTNHNGINHGNENDWGDKTPVPSQYLQIGLSSDMQTQSWRTPHIFCIPHMNYDLQVDVIEAADVKTRLHKQSDQSSLMQCPLMPLIMPFIVVSSSCACKLVCRLLYYCTGFIVFIRYVWYYVICCTMWRQLYVAVLAKFPLWDNKVYLNLNCCVCRFSWRGLIHVSAVVSSILLLTSCCMIFTVFYTGED